MPPWTNNNNNHEEEDEEEEQVSLQQRIYDFFAKPTSPYVQLVVSRRSIHSKWPHQDWHTTAFASVVPLCVLIAAAAIPCETETGREALLVWALYVSAFARFLGFMVWRTLVNDPCRAYKDMGYEDVFVTLETWYLAPCVLMLLWNHVSVSLSMSMPEGVRVQVVPELGGGGWWFTSLAVLWATHRAAYCLLRSE